jgi:hypothetical protein
MTMMALTLGSVIALSSGWIIRILYSGTYGSASLILAIHVWP